MTSLLTTMLVSLLSFPGAPPAQAQPLSPHCTLQQSASCVTASTYTLHDTLDAEDEPNFSLDGRAFRLLQDELNYSTHPSSSPRSKEVKRLKLADNLLYQYSNARTRGQFKPQRAQKGTSSYQLRQFAEATLGSGSLRKAVKLPEGEDLNEWLAVNGEPEEVYTGTE